MPTGRLRYVVALAIASLPFLALGTAAAEPICELIDDRTGVCLVEVVVPPPPSAEPVSEREDPADTGSGASCYFDPSRQGHSVPAGPVPCSGEYGAWNNGLQCYVRVLDPQPGADDPAWDGHTPEEGGAIYQCYQPLPLDIDIYLWLASPPEASGSGPSPRQVAEMAIDEMNLRAITIGIAPEPGVGSIGLVGMPVWMWAAEPGPSTVGPVTASASAGGITVTATARINKIIWDMGDGHTVVCRGAGTAYNAGYGRAQSPDCGHVYTTSSSGEPGERFTVTANSDWVITWEGAGQTGTIRMGGLTESVQVAVGEAQVLVTS
ncbi:hypothetical protein [Georgenia muralis]|uniref:ATP/GTP-binding protein n=1 Tax=Georgenia muralis TaxID=154117 RepID=A0A3N4ZBE0_9MICO|nr:hypothetical protein [Georgenia muralis]RPF28570.1 hypothetical protein EDD32_3103 [Georgenia muralis]